MTQMKRHQPLFLLTLPVLAVAALLYATPRPAGTDGAEPPGLFDATGSGLERLGHGALQVTPRTVSHLKAAFARIGYDPDDLTAAVPRLRVRVFPGDLGKVARTVERKHLFYQSLLPVILLENERVAKERAWFEDILARHDAGLPVTAYERAWLRALADRYGVRAPALSDTGRAALLKRVNVVPPSLALATAALESGWGTSRFAGEGNNLFGQWTFRPGTGLVPLDRPDGAHYELAVFPDLSASFRAYLHNLNTHWAYARFRDSRAQAASLDTPDAAIALARSLERYSTRGDAYTADLVRIIRRNNLFRFDRATLHAPGTALRAEGAPGAAEAVS
jgi:Bax protein